MEKLAVFFVCAACFLVVMAWLILGIIFCGTGESNFYHNFCPSSLTGKEVYMKR